MKSIFNKIINNFLSKKWSFNIVRREEAIYKEKSKKMTLFVVYNVESLCWEAYLEKKWDPPCKSNLTEEEFARIKKNIISQGAANGENWIIHR